MKRNFYFKAMTLLAGMAMGATAYAAPVVTPAPGNVANSLGDVDIVWDGYTVDFNTACTTPISVTLNNTPAEDWDFSYNLIDANGWVIYEDDPFAGAPVGIRITMPFFWSEDGSLDCDYTLSVPAGFLTLTAADGTIGQNEVINAAWNVIGVGELETDPIKGSVLPSLSTFNISWGDWKLSLNPDCNEKLTVGGNPCEVKINADGTATVTVDPVIEINDYVYGEVPAGFFILSKGGVEVLSPMSSDITYEISIYSADPRNFATLTTPFDRFTIYSNSPEFIGNVADVKLIDPDIEGEDNTLSVATSATKVEVDGRQGIEFVFPTAITGWTGFKAIIPANSISFDGKAYGTEIVLDYFVHELPAPNVNPASGSYLVSLDKVEIDWNNSILMDNSEWNEDLEATIQFGDAEPQVISRDCISVETEYEMVDNPFWGPQEEAVSSKIVIDFGETPYTAEGNYVITIPAGWVSLNEYDYLDNSELVLNYVVNAKAATPMEAGVVNDPQGKYQTSMGYVTLAWEEEILTIAPDAKALLILDGEEYELDITGIHIYPDDEPVMPLSLEDELVINGISIDMPPFELFGKTGEYKYVVKAATVRNANGQPNPEQEFSFIVLPTTTVDPVVTPDIQLSYGYGEANVPALSTVTINWNNLPLEIAAGAEFRLDESIIEDVKVENNTLVLNVLPIIGGEDGTYNVIIPSAAVIIDSEELNGDITLIYTTSEQSLVEVAEADFDGIYRVYNLNGVNVLTTGNADDLRTLSNGVYVINGKKVLLAR